VGVAEIRILVFGWPEPERGGGEAGGRGRGRVSATKLVMVVVGLVWVEASQHIGRAYRPIRRPYSYVLIVWLEILQAILSGWPERGGGESEAGGRGCGRVSATKLVMVVVGLMG